MKQRQAPNGGFVDVRSATAEPRDDAAHVAHTFQAVASLKLLASEIPNSAACRAFVHACQSRDGGYLARPESQDGADIYYTWCG